MRFLASISVPESQDKQCGLRQESRCAQGYAMPCHAMPPRLSQHTRACALASLVRAAFRYAPQRAQPRRVRLPAPTVVKMRAVANACLCGHGVRYVLQARSRSSRQAALPRRAARSNPICVHASWHVCQVRLPPPLALTCEGACAHMTCSSRMPMENLSSCLPTLHCPPSTTPFRLV